MKKFKVLFARAKSEGICTNMFSWFLIGLFVMMAAVLLRRIDWSMDEQKLYYVSGGLWDDFKYIVLYPGAFALGAGFVELLWYLSSSDSSTTKKRFAR